MFCLGIIWSLKLGTLDSPRLLTHYSDFGMSRAHKNEEKNVTVVRKVWKVDETELFQVKCGSVEMDGT